MQVKYCCEYSWMIGGNAITNTWLQKSDILARYMLYTAQWMVVHWWRHLYTLHVHAAIHLTSSMCAWTIQLYSFHDLMIMQPTCAHIPHMHLKLSAYTHKSSTMHNTSTRASCEADCYCPGQWTYSLYSIFITWRNIWHGATAQGSIVQ